MTVMFNKIRHFLVLGLITLILESSKGESANNGLISGRDECGKMASDVPIKAFPWTALLKYEDENTNRTEFICSGTLIGPRHVITTASCDNPNQNLVGRKLISVRLGEWNLETSTDCIEEKLSMKQCSDPPLNLEVESTISYHNFTSRKSRPNWFHNNIGLVKLATNVEFTDFIRPICLPDLGDETKLNSTLEAITWGANSSESKMILKQKLTMRVVENSNCRHIFEKLETNITHSEICAIGVDGKATTHKDLGGPLMNRFKEKPQQWYLEGILSFGALSEGSEIPDVFTKVSSYLDWIHENIK